MSECVCCKLALLEMSKVVDMQSWGECRRKFMEDGLDNFFVHVFTDLLLLLTYLSSSRHYIPDLPTSQSVPADPAHSARIFFPVPGCCAREALANSFLLNFLG